MPREVKGPKKAYQRHPTYLIVAVQVSGSRRSPAILLWPYRLTLELIAERGQGLLKETQTQGGDSDDEMDLFWECYLKNERCDSGLL